MVFVTTVPVSMIIITSIFITLLINKVFGTTILYINIIFFTAVTTVTAVLFFHSSYFIFKSRLSYYFEVLHIINLLTEITCFINPS